MRCVERGCQDIGKLYNTSLGAVSSFQDIPTMLSWMILLCILLGLVFVSDRECQNDVM